MRSVLITLAALSLGSFSAIAQEKATSFAMRESVDQWLAAEGMKQGKRAADKALEDAAFRLKSAEIRRVGKKPGEFASAADKREAVTTAREALSVAKAKAKRPTPALPKLLPHSLAVGQVGRIRRLCGFVFEESVHREYEVQQIIDVDSMLIRMRDELNEKSVTLWINMPTAGLVDGRKYQAGDDCFEVVGTKTYATIAGSNTVFELQPFDISPHIEKFASK